jgi:hypothetical protein
MGAPDVRQADVSDLSFLAELDQRSDGLLERNRRVDGVQLVQVDAFESEPLKAGLAYLPEALGAAVGRERSLTRPYPAWNEAPFGSYEHLGWIGIEGLGNQTLTLAVSVYVRRVNELDS